MRDILPLPSTARHLKGNRNYYRIAQIRSLTERISEDEVILKWGQDIFGITPVNAAQVRYIVHHSWKEFDLERPEQ